MPTVLLAPDKFKGSLTAAEVVAAVAKGILSTRADVEIIGIPVADGGEGTLDAALAAGFTHVPIRATGPTGIPVWTGFARRCDVAVVELANVAGLRRLPHGVPRPITATSRGVGELIAAAIRHGCLSVILGVGGSACTDGGAGMVRGLGGRLLGKDGREVPEGGVGLASVTELDLRTMHDLLDGVSITLASDVDNPLVGDFGAAAAYGPQKGATSQQVQLLDSSLDHWADRVAQETGADRRTTAGAGAAGGVGFAALALLGAKVVPGIEFVLDLARFADHISRADLVITGEGMIDHQTLRGKAPAGVSAAARTAGVPAIAVCGSTTLTARQLKAQGIAACYSLTDIEPDIERCLEDASSLLEQVGIRIARLHVRDT